MGYTSELHSDAYCTRRNGDNDETFYAVTTVSASRRGDQNNSVIGEKTPTREASVVAHCMVRLIWRRFFEVAFKDSAWR